MASTESKPQNAKVTRSQWIQFLALVFGAFVAIEAMAFQAPAIPVISQHFKLPTYLAGLILLTFYVASATLYPIVGRLADQYGRKKMLLIGMVIFAISEVAAAIAPDFTVFLIARVFQGVAVGFILPIAIAYIGVIFPPEKRGMASGIFSSVQAIAAMSGAAIAGYLILQYGWPIIYWISAALAFLGLIVVLIFVEESKGEKQSSFDYIGLILIFVTSATLLSVSTIGKTFGFFSSYTIITLIVGIVALTLLWICENRINNPLVELSLLKIKLFSMAVGINLLIVATFMLFIYCMNFFITSRPGGDASQTGLFYMFLYGASSIGGLVVGRLSDKINGRSILIAIFFIPTIVMFIFTMLDASMPFNIIATLAVCLGFVSGANTPILMKFALNEVPKEKLAAGAGLFSFIRDFGTPLGSVSGIVLFSIFKDAAFKETLVANATEAGITSEHSAALLAAGQTGTVENSALAEHLTSLGVSFESIYTTANAAGLTSAVHSIAYIAMALFATILFLCFLIPKAKKAPATAVIASEMVVVEETVS
ncbi:MFS transporter [Lysinibacillus sp. JNUCC-52]|uniref:MFS transporter n=1 Tax=Lysinibacillus sp. JNUCC-52 TaxID=2792480 RepID=UPI0019375D0A|nr:MFS transporter [Lysinibacillus sp. JNUCC-52]